MVALIILKTCCSVISNCMAVSLRLLPSTYRTVMICRVRLSPIVVIIRVSLSNRLSTSLSCRLARIRSRWMDVYRTGSGASTVTCMSVYGYSFSDACTLSLTVATFSACRSSRSILRMKYSRSCGRRWYCLNSLFVIISLYSPRRTGAGG